MPSKSPQNCWEFMNCDKNVREKCPAYVTNSGRECWFVASYYKDGGCPKSKGNYETCFKCPWFRKLNPSFEVTKPAIIQEIESRIKTI